MESASAVASNAIAQFGNQINKSINELNRKVIESRGKEEREEFTRNYAPMLSSNGLNVVIISTRHMYKGDVSWTIKEVGGREYYVYMVPHNIEWGLENLGDGGYENWSISGQNWVRWGKIVKFHNHWNSSSMGEPYQVRDQKDFPGWNTISGPENYVAPKRV